MDAHSPELHCYVVLVVLLKLLHSTPLCRQTDFQGLYLVFEGCLQGVEL